MSQLKLFRRGNMGTLGRP